MLYTVSLKFIFIWFLNLRPESELAEQSKTKIQNQDICIKSLHKNWSQYTKGTAEGGGRI